MARKGRLVSTLSLEQQMHRAIRLGHYKRCVMLLNKGVDPNSKGYSWQTFLHIAAYCDNAKIYQLLIDRGADILVGWKYEEIYEYETPLEGAARSGHVDVCRVIVAAGLRRFPVRAGIRNHSNGFISYAPGNGDNVAFFRCIDEARKCATGEALDYLNSIDAYELKIRLEPDTAPAIAPSRRMGRL